MVQLQMNVNSLQVSPSPQLSWSTVRAQEKESDFLSLRLLNKRTRIRLSTQPLDLNVVDGKGNYFAVSNAKGWYAAITLRSQGEYFLVFSSLNDLRESIVSSTADSEEDFSHKRALRLEATPTHLTFGLNDERLVVGFANGFISVYDTSVLFVPGDEKIEPLHVFPPGPPGALRQILGNPADLPDLVAVRRDAESGADGLAVEILDVRQLQSVGGWRNGNTPETVPTSIAWSTKGKQLAIGLRNGDIVTYSPSSTDTIKLHVPKPPCVGDCSIITIMWLSNQAFYGIYAPPGSSDPEVLQRHVLTHYDPKTTSATQTELETPYYASPALRPPGAFTVVMRNWDPAKLLIFIGDSTSSDVGVVGNLAENGSSTETWCNLSLEETSTPSVPLDRNAEDTVPLALEMDVTIKKDGDHNNPLPPVLYLYASDGTLQAWYVSNEKAGSYPGMFIPPAESLLVSATRPSPKEPEQPTSLFSQPLASTSALGSNGFGGGAPKFGQTSNPVFGSSGFASHTHSAPPPAEQVKSAFGQTSAPVFGSSSFGQSASTPAFGQKSTFGQTIGASAFNSNAQSAFGQQPPSHFGAFSSQTPSKFDSTGFGFGSASPAANPSLAQADSSKTENPASPEAEMSEADDSESSGLGGLSLGQPEGTNKKLGNGVNSMFGVTTQEPIQGSPAPSTFGSTFGSTPNSFGAFGSVQGSSFMKPATGFGAFYKPEATQTTPNANTNSSSAGGSNTSSAFGVSGFASVKPQSAFGQSAFGQTAFGAPSVFGKTSVFGAAAQTPPSASSVGSSATGAFATFAGANKGFNAFAQSGQSSFGQQIQSSLPKHSEAPSISMAISSDSSGTNVADSTIGTDKSGASSGLPQNSSDAKPTSSLLSMQNEKTNASSSNTEQQVSGSVFRTSASPASSSNSVTNTIGGGQFPSGGAQQQATSAFSVPTARSHTPISSPEGSPILGHAKVLTQDSPKGEAEDIIEESSTPSQTPTSSPFKSSQPVTTGAFANLRTTPSVFKPAEGFGAFGAAKAPTSSSPFAHPGAASAFSTPAKPVSAFGLGGSGPAQAFNTPSTTPTFGTPSTPRGLSVFEKYSFGTPSPNPSEATTKPTTKAFAGYSNSGGFSAFAGAAKPSSFSDLLRSKQDGEAQKPSVSSSSSKGAKALEVSGSVDEQKKGESQDGKNDIDNPNPNRTSSLKGELTFINVSILDEIDHDNLPPTPSTHGTFDDEDQDLGDEQGNSREDSDSFLSESFSEGSEGGQENDQEEEVEESEEGEVKEEEEGNGEDNESTLDSPERKADLQSLPSSDSRDITPKLTSNVPFSGEDAVETPPKSSNSTMKSDMQSARVFSVFSKPESSFSTITPTKSSTFTQPGKSSTPSVFAESAAVDGLPAGTSSKSPVPSLFGKPLLFGNAKESPENSPSPSVFAKPSTLSTDVQSRSQSPTMSSNKSSLSSLFATTTPPGSPEKAEEPTVLAPKAVAPQVSSTSSLGLGRPNSRPIRSSPLAGASVFGDEGKPNVQNLQSATATSKARPASPRRPFGQLPVDDVKHELASPATFKSFGNQSPASTSKLPPSGGLSPTPIKPPQLASAIPASGNAPFTIPSTPTGTPAPVGTSFNLATKAPVNIVNGKPAGIPSVQQVTRPETQPQSTFESSMQKECHTLYTTMMDEFVQLQRTSQAAVAMRMSLGRPSSSVHTRDDLGDKTKWSFGDLDAFGKLIKGLEKDVLTVYELKNEVIPVMREIESNLLKAETRKEEIVRFSKAKADPEFARMLKARTLGPDAAETQSQLRKHIRLINDRVEQLEAHLKACKKRLEEHRKGKASMKPPSLDTVNRTYRNIDVAIEMQAQQIAALTYRVAKLKLDFPDRNLHSSLSSRSGKHNPESFCSSSSTSIIIEENKREHFRPQVTPSIAASTAAALNAERSALRLKIALSKARKTPILNTQAVEPTTCVRTLASLHKSTSSSTSAAGSSNSMQWSSPLNASLENLRDADSSGENQRRPTRQAAHAKSVKLGKTQAKLPSSITSFDWGPLPGAKPMTTLPSDIRPESIKRMPS